MAGAQPEAQLCTVDDAYDLLFHARKAALCLIEIVEQDPKGGGASAAALLAATRIVRAVAKRGVVAHWRDGRFLAVMPGVGRELSEGIARKACLAVSDAPFTTSRGKQVRLSCLVGASQCRVGRRHRNRDLESALAKAEAALEVARRGGNGQVVSLDATLAA
jgi:GGDEF domain-containing protein